MTLVGFRNRLRRMVPRAHGYEPSAPPTDALGESRRRFLSNLSGEFRTPLTLLIGPLEELIDGAFRDDPARQREQLRLMHRNARRLLHLVDRLLELARLDLAAVTLQPVPGDLVAFARELTRTYDALARQRHLTLAFHSDLKVLRSLFDPAALEKVLANLLANAVAYTPEDGRILVTLTIREQGAAAALSVRDSGPGIPYDDLERIFTPFEHAVAPTHRTHEGIGIGLTLARTLAELHGGHLTVESQVGFGSTFTVSLPLR